MDNRGFQLRLGLDIKDFKSSIDYSKKVALEAKKDYNALNRELKNSEQTYQTLSRQISKANLALQEQEKVMSEAKKRVEELNKVKKENGKLTNSETNELSKMKNAYNDAARTAGILKSDIENLNKTLNSGFGSSSQIIKKFNKNIEEIKFYANEAKKDYSSLNKELKYTDQTFKTLSSQIKLASIALEGQEKIMADSEQALKKLNRAEQENGKLTEKQEKEKRAIQATYNDASREAKILSSEINNLNDKLEKNYGDAAKVEKISKSLSSAYDVVGEKAKKAVDLLGKGISGLGSGVQAVGRGVSTVGTTLTASVTAPIAGAFAYGTKSAIKFEDELTTIGALGDISGKKLKELGNNSIALSSKYGISTTKVNESLQELIKTGFSAATAQDYMKVAMNGAMAAGEDYNNVSTALLGTIKAYGVNVQDAKDVTKKANKAMDELVYVANASSTSVTELGEGLANVATQAAGMNIPLSEVTAAIGALADVNVNASSAGNGLKTGLARITEAVGKINSGGKLNASAQAFKRMGLNIDEINKHGISLPRVLQDIRKGTEGMTDTEKAYNIELAFGKDHLRTWSALLSDQGYNSLIKYKKGAEEAKGSTEELAEKMRKSPKYALDVLKESANNTLTIFSQGFVEAAAPKLLELADKASGLAKAYSDMDDKQKIAIAGIAGVTAVAPPVVLVLGKITEVAGGALKTVGSVVSSIKDIGKIKLSTLGIVGAIAAISLPMLDTIKNSDDLKKTLGDMWDTIKKKYEESGLKDSIEELGDAFHDLFFSSSKKKKGSSKGDGKKTKDEFSELVDFVMPLLKGTVDLLTTAIDLFNKMPDGSLQTIATIYLIKKALDIVSGKILKTTEKVGKFKKKIGELKGTPTQTIKAVGSSFGDTGKLIVKTSEKVAGLGKKIKDLATDKGKRSQTLDTISTQLKEVEDQAKDTKMEYGNLYDEVFGVSGAFDPKGRKTNSDKNNKNNKTKGKGPSALTSSSIEEVDTALTEVGRKASEANGKVEKIIKTYNGDGTVKISSGKKGLKVIGSDLDTLKKKAEETSNKVGDVYSSASDTGSGKSKKSKKSSKSGKSGKLGKFASGLGKIGLIAEGVEFFGGIVGSLLGVDLSITAVIGALGSLATAIGAFVVANPVVAGIIAAAAAIAGGFYWCYKHVEKFRDTVNSVAKKVSDKTQEMAKNVSKWMGDIKGYYDDCRESGDSWGTAMIKTVDKVITDINDKVLHWLLPDEWADKLMGKSKGKKKSVKSETERFSNMVAGKDGIVHNTLQDISNMISNNTSIPDATAKKAKEAYDPVSNALESTGVSAGELVNTLGGDGKKYSGYKPKELKKHADGTDSHPGGLAMVNDGFGPHYREIVTLPNGHSFIPKGKNVIMDLPKGTQVTNGRDTNSALKSGLIKYADGTKGQKGIIGNIWGGIKNIGSNIANSMKNFVGDVMDWIDKPKELVNKVIDKFVGKFAKSPRNISESLAKNSVDRAKPSFVNIIQDLFSSMFSEGANGLDDAIAANGVYKYLVDMAMDIIRKFGGVITSGYRPGSRNETGALDDHSQRQAIDIAGVSYGTFDKMKHYAVDKYKNKGLKYVIANNTWSRKSVGWAWTQYPYGAHMDHMHLSGEKPSGKIFNAGDFKYSGNGVMPRSQISMLVKRALKANGLPDSGAWYNMVMNRVYQESGGNPKAINLWDSNAAAGHPSKGLVQMIDSTFNAYKFPGHNNIYNPYDNLLSAINYMKQNYGLQGMLNRVGIGYENGGLVTNHQIAHIGEGGKPEMVIPLTNKTRSVQLINKARKLIGEKEIETDTSDLKDQNKELKSMNEKLSNMIDILSALLMKDSNIYVDGEKVSEQLARPMTTATNRINRNDARLHGLV